MKFPYVLLRVTIHNEKIYILSGLRMQTYVLRLKYIH